MKPIACLLAFSATLLAAHLALAQAPGQPERAPVAKGRVQLLGADMAGSCKTGDIERAHRLADACEGRKQCSFTPQVESAAAEACARDSMALWDCGDGKTRYAALGPQNKNQSREIRLECPPDTVADAPKPATPTSASGPVTLPQATASAVAPPTPGNPETVTVDELRKNPPTIRVQRAAPTSIDMSAAGVSRACDLGQKTQFAGMDRIMGGSGRSGSQTLFDLKNSRYDRPDHSPDAVANDGVRGQVGNSNCP